jgi:hypothetical protein
MTNTGLIKAGAQTDSYAEAYIAMSGGSFTNSGTIEALAANDSEASAEIYSAEGGLFVNKGTVEAWATQDSDSYAEISGTDVTSVTNSGTMVASATVDAFSEVEIYLDGGTLTNVGTIEALATSSATAEVYIDSATIDNVGGTILASGDGTSEAYVEIEYSTVSGGTLKATGPFAFISAYDDTFTSVTIASGTLVATYDGLTIDDGTIGSGATVADVSGTVTVEGTVTNSGTLFASGSGSLVDIVSGAVVNGGVAEVGDGIVEIDGSSSENVTFYTGGTGGLELADNATSNSLYGGTVSGFGGVNNANTAQYIELTSYSFDSSVESATFDDTNGTSGGVLEVFSASTEVAAINLAGNYTHASFVITDEGGDLGITDPSTLGYSGSQNGGDTGVLGSYMASTFPDIGVSNGGTVITALEEHHHATLTTQH